MAVCNMQLKDIIKYEFRYMFCHNSKIIFILLGLPILYTILFGLAYNANIVKNIPTLIYDQDQTPISLAFIQSFADSERYHIVAQVTSQEEMMENLHDGNALVAVVIPPNFAQDIKLGKSSQVLITISTANLMFSNAIIGSVPEIVQTYSAAIGQKSLEGLNQTPSQALSSAAPIRLAMRVLHNPTFSYSNFMLPGLGLNGLQLAIMLAICYILAREYTRISHWAGTSVPSIILGKLVPYWLLSMTSFVLCLLMNIALFDVPCKGDVGSLLLIGSAFTYAIINVGTFFSAIAPNIVYAVQLPMLYIMPAYLFSGYSWPILAMNDFSKGFAAILPITYAADTLRDLLLAGYSPSLFINTTLLFIFGSVLFFLSSFLFSLRRKKLLHTSREAIL